MLTANDIKRRISRTEMEFEMMVYKTMVAKNHQESMAWAERAHDKELALEALEEELMKRQKVHNRR